MFGSSQVHPKEMKKLLKAAQNSIQSHHMSAERMGFLSNPENPYPLIKEYALNHSIKAPIM